MPDVLEDQQGTQCGWSRGSKGRVIGNNRGGGNGWGADFLQLLLSRIHGRDFSRGYNML